MKHSDWHCGGGGSDNDLGYYQHYEESERSGRMQVQIGVIDRDTRRK